jgi:hypothetical protein
MTYSLIESSRRIAFLATGAQKKHPPSDQKRRQLAPGGGVAP